MNKPWALFLYDCANGCNFFYFQSVTLLNLYVSYGLPINLLINIYNIILIQIRIILGGGGAPPGPTNPLLWPLPRKIKLVAARKVVPAQKFRAGAMPALGKILHGYSNL